MLSKQIKNSKTESDYTAFSFLLEYWWGYVVASAALRELLSGYGVMELEIFLSEEPPKQHPISGKFKHVINEPKKQRKCYGIWFFIL